MNTDISPDQVFIAVLHSLEEKEFKFQLREEQWLGIRQLFIGKVVCFLLSTKSVFCHCLLILNIIINDQIIYGCRIWQRAI